MKEPNRRAIIQRRQDYSHSPLDASDPTAIRLFRVSGDLSKDGLIQGEIIHANTDAKYTCLSYCWGPQNPRHDILIKSEGKPDTILAVRPNLWEFLNAARWKFPYSSDRGDIGWRRPGPDNSLWIDALCIVQKKPKPDKKHLATKKRRANEKYMAKPKPEDQREKMNRSDVAFSADEQGRERNHQVQMMGKIYDQRKVIAWLGNDTDVGKFVQRFEIEDINYSAGGKKFMHTKYLSRAWITQELHLARWNKILQLSESTNCGSPT